MDIVRNAIICACNNNDIDALYRIISNAQYNRINSETDKLLNVIRTFLYLQQNDIHIAKQQIDNDTVIQAASFGLTHIVKYFIEEDFDLNYYDDYYHCGLDYGSSPFSEAARNGHIDTIKYLLLLHKNNNKYPKVNMRDIKMSILSLIRNYSCDNFEENIQNKKRVFLFLLKINKDIQIPFLDDIVQSKHFRKFRPEFTNKIKNDHVNFFVYNVINCGGVHINKKYDSALLYKPHIII